MGQISQRLSDARECHTHLFGGVHIVFAGDLYQLPPVRASSIFMPVDRYKTAPGSLTLSGHAIWQNGLNACIMLQESVRFVKDPAWGQMNEEIRHGRWTQQIVDSINTRYIEDPDERAQCLQALLERGLEYVPIVVTRNRDRVKFNNHMISLSLQTLTPDNPAIRIPAVIKTPKKSRRQALSKKDLKVIYGLSSEHTNNLQMTLDVFVGMPVQITKNICTEKGVANGVIGFVAGFQYQAIDAVGSDVVMSTKSRDGMSMPSHDVEIVFVKIPGNEHFFSDALPAGVVPLIKKKEYTKCQRHNRHYSFSVEQFPIVPAFALTVFKTQGLTLNRMIIGSWGMTNIGRGYRTPNASAYVMLSRVCELNSLLLLERLNLNDIKKCTPPPELVVEMERLDKIEKLTLDRVLQTSRMENMDVEL